MLTIESLIPVIGLCVACFRAFFKHALVYCIVDICQKSAEQGFSGKARAIRTRCRLPPSISWG